MSGKCTIQEVNSSRVLERFFDKVEKTDTCWNWLASCWKVGYGQFWFNNHHTYSHRISYEIHKGKIPNGMLVCHTCDNRKCVNPDHLFLGNRKDNVADMINKKRHARGEMKSNHKLKKEDIPLLRFMASKGFSKNFIARYFKVNPETVRYVILRKTWTHI